MLRTVFTIIGVVVLVMGGLWTLQGLGLVMWPASSFMLGQRQWATYGVITMAVGVILIWLARRRKNGS
ncbi:hypothetical protein [Croceicoccus mobilis]|uniref:Uncharacterized protein n=1 Tax=Croceicoccus mobilis TaxID=1703339 RepID=A0A917DX93_9SPHN|nr:hypothetical protein [Croceicoccus mobilis]GGD76338.1 hypothetical protein GCM10010990_27480 [Croceicoccus mobilis]